MERKAVTQGAYLRVQPVAAIARASLPGGLTSAAGPIAARVEWLETTVR